MLQMSQEQKNSYLKDNTTIALCLKITLKNGKEIAYTTHTQNIVFKEEPEIVYRSKGFIPTATSYSSDMSVDNVDADMIIDNENIIEDYLEKGVFNNAKYVIFWIDYNSKDQDGYYNYKTKLVNSWGVIGSIKREYDMFKIEYRSAFQYFATNIIDVTKATCSAEFGDFRCTKNLDDYTHVFNVSAVIKNNELLILDCDKENNYFKNGVIFFEDHLNSKCRIKNWNNTTKVLTLQSSPYHNISENENVKMIAGCSRNKDSCKSFNNYENYQGFPDLPGQDFLASGGGTKVNY